MKKRILQITLIFFIILGFNLLCQGEVAGLELKPDDYGNLETKLYYTLDFWDSNNKKTVGHYAATIYIQKVVAGSEKYSGTNFPKKATMYFYTTGMNAITIYNNQFNNGDANVRGPADATTDSKEIFEMNQDVEDAVGKKYAGEIVENAYFDESRGAVFPGKKYMFKLNLPDLSGKREECYLDAKIGNKDMRKVNGLYEMKVPELARKDSDNESNFANNEVRVTADYLYHEYKAYWKVEIEYKNTSNPYQVKKAFTTSNSDPEQALEKDITGKTLKEKFAGDENYDIGSNTFLYIYDANDTREEGNKKLIIIPKSEKEMRKQHTGSGAEIASFNLLADVTVNQWTTNVSNQTITDINGEYSNYRRGENAIQYVDTAGNLKEGTTDGERESWTELKKQEQKVVLENGQYFKYKLRVENHNESSAVLVRLKTEVDGICDPKRITWRDSNKLER